MESFVYVWKDRLANKRYIGSHKGQPDDGYICSSETMMEQYKDHPDFFVRKILAYFETYDEAHKYETKLLQKIDAANSVMFYNRHNGTGKFYSKKGVLKSERAKRNMRGPRPHINQTGDKNNAFRGYYITPWGKFGSSTEAAKNCFPPVDHKLIWGYCKNPEKIIRGSGRNKIVQPSWIGRTHKDVGFGFEPKEGVS